jgi:multisubunit Na+/H+ antiporter MnhB subunit
MGGAELVDFIILIVVVPLMAFLGFYFLGSAILAIYRDVLGIDDKVSELLDRGFGTGLGLARTAQGSGLSGRLVVAGIAAIFAFLAYLTLRYGVVEPIAWHVFGYDISAS